MRRDVHRQAIEIEFRDPFADGHRIQAAKPVHLCSVLDEQTLVPGPWAGASTDPLAYLGQPVEFLWRKGNLFPLPP